MSAGAPPQTPLEKLTALGAYSAPPDLLAGFEVPTFKGRDGKEGEGEMEGMGRGLLLGTR